MPRLLQEPPADAPHPRLVHHPGRGAHRRAVPQTQGVSLHGRLLGTPLSLAKFKRISRRASAKVQLVMCRAGVLSHSFNKVKVFSIFLNQQLTF